MKQVDKKHYEFSSYAHPARFGSYFHQLKEIHDADPQNVLEVGVGDQVVGNYLRSNTGIGYTSVDIAEDLKPDVVGSVLALPFKDRSFDVVCAFEVLEHIPYESFEKAVSEMTRVAKRRVLISVPHFGRSFRFLIKIPGLGEHTFLWKLPFSKKHVWDGQHYWEIGKTGFPLSRIRESLERHGKLLRDYVPFENDYHHFFILEKR